MLTALNADETLYRPLDSTIIVLMFLDQLRTEITNKIKKLADELPVRSLAQIYVRIYLVLLRS